jgi:hypothetical protein
MTLTVPHSPIASWPLTSSVPGSSATAQRLPASATRPPTGRLPESSSRSAAPAPCADVPVHRRAVPELCPPVLARYTDVRGRQREVLALPGHRGSTLVVDRDAFTWGDRRLVAHLASDEPLENAHIVCRHYLQDRRVRRCRALSPEDLLTAPFAEEADDRHREEHEDHERGHDESLRTGLDRAAPGAHSRSEGRELRDIRGRLHRLEPLDTGLSIPELRWCRRAVDDQARRTHTDGERPRCGQRPESVRDAIACMESYDPVRSITVSALARHRGDPSISVAVLRSELQRIDASRIVLNRELRRAVLRATQAEGLSLSEIAFRCGRVKRDANGNASGETSWLARRVGIAPESGRNGEPTPWIHSEVLALIAREGLGVSPHEVEL